MSGEAITLNPGTQQASDGTPTRPGFQRRHVVAHSCDISLQTSSRTQSNHPTFLHVQWEQKKKMHTRHHSLGRPVTELPQYMQDLSSIPVTCAMHWCPSEHLPRLSSHSRCWRRFCSRSSSSACRMAFSSTSSSSPRAAAVFLGLAFFISGCTAVVPANSSTAGVFRFAVGSDTANTACEQSEDSIAQRSTSTKHNATLGINENATMAGHR